MGQAQAKLSLRGKCWHQVGAKRIGACAQPTINWHVGNKHTKASKKKAKETASSSGATAINELQCKVCGSAESIEGNVMVLCSFSIAHAENTVGYREECLDELNGGAPEGEWKCPCCKQEEANSGLYEMEAILNKRCDSMRQHTARCMAASPRLT